MAHAATNSRGRARQIIVMTTTAITSLERMILGEVLAVSATTDVSVLKLSDWAADSRAFERKLRLCLLLASYELKCLRGERTC